MRGGLHTVVMPTTLSGTQAAHYWSLSFLICFEKKTKQKSLIHGVELGIIQNFSAGGDPAPQGTLGHVWDICGCHDLGWGRAKKLQE